jgi:ATP-dependent RNA circularization protein (DNA/RNA ligase family)
MECVLKGLFTILNAQHSIVIQGEIIGPKIQKNKYNLMDIDFYAFNLIVDGKNTSIHDIEAKIVSNDLELKKVPVISSMVLFGKEVDEILDTATFKSKITSTTHAEGLVFRTFDENGVVLDSFKAISPLFLIKNDE